MLAYIRCCKMSGTSAHSYLGSPDIRDNQWLTRNKGETAGFFCDVNIELTEELKLYLLYFSFTTGKNCTPSITSFSEIPMKHQTVEKSNC